MRGTGSRPRHGSRTGHGRGRRRVVDRTRRDNGRRRWGASGASSRTRWFMFVSHLPLPFLPRKADRTHRTNGTYEIRRLPVCCFPFTLSLVSASLFSPFLTPRGIYITNGKGFKIIFGALEGCFDLVAFVIDRDDCESCRPFLQPPLWNQKR